MNRILIIDDDRTLCALLEASVRAEQLEADSCQTAQQGLALLQANRYQLVVLDVMLPGMDGIEIVRRLRADADTAKLPIIMLTARQTEMDKVTGLDAGADDYITKPFAIEELLARIRATLRKKTAREAPRQDLLTVGDIAMDPESRTVTRAGEPVTLTRREFDLLRYLMEHPNRALTRDQLLSQVWGYDYAGETNAVDVYISFLRNKLGSSVVETVRGVGYILRKS